MTTLKTLKHNGTLRFQEFEQRNGRRVYLRSWPSREAYVEAQQKELARATKEYPQLDITPRHRPRRLVLGHPVIMEPGDIVLRSAEIASDSIDAIVTDPPYPKEYVPLYGTLAEVAKRVLKPGGSLIAMAGQSYLPEIMQLLSSHLTYQWTTAYLTPGGQAVQLWQRKVNTFWKPLLWFVKGDYQGKWIGDVAKSAVNANEKSLHEWQQSESGMMDIVDRFTKRGDTVLDPFMGSGTTGFAAIKMGRNFIGFDKSTEATQTARARLEALVK